MYITISAQRIKGNFNQSAADFVAYLDKENQGREAGEIEHFFNQNGEEITSEAVIREIDANTAKLKTREPKFYSITLNPSQRELKQIKDSPEALKRYTREVMKEYARYFNREIEGRPVSVNDIKYFAKVEHERTFKGSDWQIQENQPFATKILELKDKIREQQNPGEIKKLQEKITRLEAQAPHKLDGKRIVRGMAKQGPQSHVHIIVSRTDASNRYSLSPGSKYKSSEVSMHGQTVKRGFDREHFFKGAEKTFDSMFGHNRNYVETYAARNTLVKHPEKYFAALLGLPTREREVALKLLGQAGIRVPRVPIPTSAAQLTLRAVRQLRRGITKAIESGSIGI